MVPANWGSDWGGTVLNLLQDETVAIVPEKPKQQLLPLLVVLFLISYGLLAFLVVEQGRTIANQRSLIQQLFQDSVELTSLKGKSIIEQQHPRPATPLKSQPQVQTPSSQNHTPSSQASPQENVATQKRTHRIQKAFPLKPPKDTEDTPDDRRNRSLV
jgi:cytoskeletal protein RodZ